MDHKEGEVLLIINHDENASVQQGRILLQSEGVEIYFRNVMIKEFE